MEMSSRMNRDGGDALRRPQLHLITHRSAPDFFVNEFQNKHHRHIAGFQLCFFLSIIVNVVKAQQPARCLFNYFFDNDGNRSKYQYQKEICHS
jgi:hypothetical protein